MRITNNQIIRQMQNTLSDRYADLAELQIQTATGKRLQKPSDQPTDIANNLRYKSDLSALSQHQKSINDAVSWTSQTDTALQGMMDPLQRLRELTIQGATDSLTPIERGYINDEAHHIMRQVIGAVNSVNNGDYVFGGTQTKIPPLEIKSSQAATADDYAQLKSAYFDGSGAALGGTVQLRDAFDNSPITNILPGSFTIKNGATTYVENTDYTVNHLTGELTILNPALAVDVSPGSENYQPGAFSISFDYVTRGKDVYGETVSNQGAVMREIEPGITARINISADELISDPSSGADMISTFISLGQDLLQSNTDGIRSGIGRIDDILNALNSARSKNGALVNRLETTLSRNEEMKVTVSDLQSKIEDADMTTVITDFMNAQNVYTAALKSTSNVIQQSLVNFL